MASGVISAAKLSASLDCAVSICWWCFSSDSTDDVAYGKSTGQRLFLAVLFRYNNLMEKFPTQPDDRKENPEVRTEPSAVSEKSTAERFAIRQMEDELRSYENDWKVDEKLGAAEKKNIETMRSTLKEGDYTLVLGQLLMDKGVVLQGKEQGTLNPKFDADARIKDIDRIITALGYQEFPKAKEVTADDAAIYLDMRASQLADFGRHHGGDMKYMKEMMQESELYRQLSNEILNPSGENQKISEEARTKIHGVLQKETGLRSRRAGTEYMSIANGEGNLEAYRNPSKESTRDTIKTLKQETEQALRVEAMGNLFKKVPKYGEKSEADERKLQQLRSEIRGTRNPTERPQPTEDRLKESRQKIGNMTINSRERNPARDAGASERVFRPEEKRDEEIKPIRLTNAQRGEVFKRFFEKNGNDYIARKNALEVAVSETDVKNFVGDVLGTIEKIKLELSEVQRQRPNVRAGSNVASILGNNGTDVVMLQILLAQKEGRVRNLEDVIAMNLKTALKQATGYEIADPEYDNFFGR
jgi:hypothetical protein